MKYKTKYNIARALGCSSKVSKRVAKKGCYIATSIYGSYDCPEVWVLRRLRDYKLEKCFLGRIFIKLYYFISPILVKLFGNTKVFKKIFKKRLDKLILKLEKDGYDSTPYNDLY